MRWRNLLHRNQRTTVEASLDIDGVLTAGLRDRSVARNAMRRLRQERARLEREQRAIQAQSRRRTPREMWSVGRAGTIASEMGAYQFSPTTTDADGSSAFRSEQSAALDARLEAINDALVLLNTYLRESA